MIDATGLKVYGAGELCGPGLRWCGLILNGARSLVQALQMA